MSKQDAKPKPAVEVQASIYYADGRDTSTLARIRIQNRVALPNAGQEIKFTIMDGALNPVTHRGTFASFRTVLGVGSQAKIVNTRQA